MQLASDSQLQEQKMKLKEASSSREEVSKVTTTRLSQGQKKTAKTVCSDQHTRTRFGRASSMNSSSGRTDRTCAVVERERQKERFGAFCPLRLKLFFLAVVEIGVRLELQSNNK